MKSRIKKIMICIFIIILNFNFVYISTNADSGWDSDYDYDYDSSDWDSSDSSDWGASWDSDYDSDSSSDNYSSGSYYDDPFSLLLIVFFVTYLLFVMPSSLNKNRRSMLHSSRKNTSTELNNYQDMDLSEIVAIDPTINIYEFKVKAFNIYRDIQIAWMNFDTESIRKLTTDEIYNMYSSQLETLKLKKQKNIMKDIIFVDAKIINLKKENNVITASVYLKVKCYDYVIKEATNEVVRGNSDKKVIIEYVITFVKSALNNDNKVKCPNCGAIVDINSSATCLHCDSILVKDSGDYVMSKKTCVGQSLER